MENILDDIFNYQVTILKNYLKDQPNQWILTEDFGKRNPVLGKFYRDGKEVDGKVKGVLLAPSGNILVYIYDGPEVFEDIEWDAFHDPNIFCLTSDELGDLKHFVINHILDYLDLLL